MREVRRAEEGGEEVSRFDGFRDGVIIASLFILQWKLSTIIHLLTQLVEQGAK